MSNTQIHREIKNAVKQQQAKYYQWLCDLVKVNQEDKSYWILFKDLHRKEFYWTVPNDDNRGIDGKLLREKFMVEEDSLIPIDGPCSMLEMIIGLALRMEDTMADPDEGDRTVQWFWEMLDNAGLSKFTDDAYYDLFGQVYVDEILDKILGRTYKRNGKGGLFPLEMPSKNQRKVELWYQMSAYLLENYYPEGKKL